jgi:hypothetical protein
MTDAERLEALCFTWPGTGPNRSVSPVIWGMSANAELTKAYPAIDQRRFQKR